MAENVLETPKAGIKPLPKSRKKVVGTPNTSRIIKQKKDGQIVVEDRMDRFLEEFLRNGGNATKAGMAMAGTDNYMSGAVIGSRYLKKAKELGRVYMDNKGRGYGKLLDIAMDNAEKSRTPEWWDRLMKVAGYEDFFAKPNAAPSVVNIVGAQNTVRKKFGFGDGAEEGEVLAGEEL